MVSSAYKLFGGCTCIEVVKKREFGCNCCEMGAAPLLLEAKAYAFSIIQIWHSEKTSKLTHVILEWTYTRYVKAEIQNIVVLEL